MNQLGSSDAVFQTIEIAGRRIRLKVPADSESRLNDLLDAGPGSIEVKDERLPYWAELWPSSVALAEEILCGPPIDADTDVLEIGCGLGLAGIAAGLRGASVVLTDYLPEAVDAARLNWEENIGTVPHVRQMDWRVPDPDLAAHLILASDVAYEERAFSPLSNAFRRLLRPGGTILLAEPQRRISRPFVDSLRETDFHCETATREARVGDLRSMIDIHTMTHRRQPKKQG